MRVLIVDDEHLARQAMRRLLAAHREVEVVGEAETIDQAIAAIKQLQPQLVFLDIELAGGDGFDLLAQLERPPVVVFVTAYAEYAVEAFEVNAVDYLLKPVAPERLAESLARVERQLALSSTSPSGTRVVALKTPKQTILVPAGDIAALRADGDFTHVYVADQPAVMIWRTLSHFEELLPAPPFLRLSRSLIINRDRLRKIETPSRAGAQITLEGVPEPVVLGRTAAARLRDALAADKS